MGQLWQSSVRAAVAQSQLLSVWVAVSGDEFPVKVPQYPIFLKSLCSGGVAGVPSSCQPHIRILPPSSL